MPNTCVQESGSILAKSSLQVTCWEARALGPGISEAAGPSVTVSVSLSQCLCLNNTVCPLTLSANKGGLNYEFNSGFISRKNAGKRGQGWGRKERTHDWEQVWISHMSARGAGGNAPVWLGISSEFHSARVVSRASSLCIRPRSENTGNSFKFL